MFLLVNFAGRDGRIERSKEGRDAARFVRIFLQKGAAEPHSERGSREVQEDGDALERVVRPFGRDVVARGKIPGLDGKRCKSYNQAEDETSQSAFPSKRANGEPG